MRSSGHLFLPDIVSVDLRIVCDLAQRSATWGWQVRDLMTQDMVWTCAHPHVDLLPSGRWLARSLLEGSDIIGGLARGDVFPPTCRGHVTGGGDVSE